MMAYNTNNQLYNSMYYDCKRKNYVFVQPLLGAQVALVLAASRKKNDRFKTTKEILRYTTDKRESVMIDKN